MEINNSAVSKKALAVAGKDRLAEASGKVTKFGSHRMWREAFDAAYMTDAQEDKLFGYYGLEGRARLNGGLGLGSSDGGRGKRRKITNRKL